MPDRQSGELVASCSLNMIVVDCLLAADWHTASLAHCSRQKWDGPSATWLLLLVLVLVLVLLLFRAQHQLNAVNQVSLSSTGKQKLVGNSLAFAYKKSTQVFKVQSYQKR